ncbi:MAG: hypothetical protein ACPG4Z_06625 [Chitinophagales bacterium]
MKTYTSNTQIFPIAGSNVFNSKVNVEQLFEMAIDFANNGMKDKAIDTAREVLIFAKQSNNYTAVYIHSFLASMMLEKMQCTHARIHCYNALNRLDKNHFDYKTDKQYLESLLVYVEKAETKVGQLEFEALAA